MDQSFNSQQLLKLCKQSEYIEYGLTEKRLLDNLNDTFNAISNETFEFEIKETNECFLTVRIEDKLVLRKLNDNIKRIYKEEQANRRLIISQVKVLLEDNCPFWVIKTDIKQFYKSINEKKLIDKFKDDSMLSYQSIFLLNKIFDNHVISETGGIPRGINISATLSEIYMRKFDKWISRFNNVYFYARFVDDIVIFLSSLNSSLELIKIINVKLAELAEGLIINKSKTELYNGSELILLDKESGKSSIEKKPLEYLGYSFAKCPIPDVRKIQNIATATNLKYITDKGVCIHESGNISKLEYCTTKKNRKKELKIAIASKKIKKIKTRIILALLDFSKNKNFGLLENRIKFLTGNYSVRRSSERNDLKAGLYYNYLHITDLCVFDELNTFYRKAIFSKEPKFAHLLSLTVDQQNRLKKYCFRAGFSKKVYYSFTFDEMDSIIKCW